MKRTPMELAAIASAAVPGLTPTGVAGAPDDAADFDSAVLIDDAGRQWRVRSPKHVEASIRLETELVVLRAFTPAVRAELPFYVPSVAGTVRQGELSTFVYSHLSGFTRDIDAVVDEGSALAEEIGKAMAAIHDLPQSLVDNADLPSYTANEYRQRRLNELDQAATTGRIPATLLRRWEQALEDVSLWRFTPSVVHGDLHEDHLLIEAGRVSAVTGWTDLHIGDPADDFAWLIAANDTDFSDAVHAAYHSARPQRPDVHLLRRAALSAEFALAQWLVRGLAFEDAEMVAEAEDMLATLEADILDQEAAEDAHREAEAERLAAEEAAQREAEEAASHDVEEAAQREAEETAARDVEEAAARSVEDDDGGGISASGDARRPGGNGSTAWGTARTRRGRPAVTVSPVPEPEATPEDHYPEPDASEKDDEPDGHDGRRPGQP